MPRSWLNETGGASTQARARRFPCRDHHGHTNPETRVNKTPSLIAAALLAITAGAALAQTAGTAETPPPRKTPER